MKTPERSSIECSVSDWTIPADDSTEAISYPNALIGGAPSMVAKLRQACMEAFADQHLDEFKIKVEGAPYRVRREVTQTGEKFFLRRFGPALPLSPSRVPSGIIHQLISEKLCRGGFILIAGPAGVGKTTTCSSTLVARLMRYGGVGWTIEDPPEYEMEGPIGKKGGVCWQKRVVQGGYAQATRDVMRCYPAGEQGILMVGEVRDAETADQCVKAALNGLLVMATIHAGDIEGAIERLVGLTSERDRAVARGFLANSLRMVIHQSRSMKNPGSVIFRSLWVGESSTSSTAIRDYDLPSLRNEMMFQANKMRMGMPIC